MTALALPFIGIVLVLALAYSLAHVLGRLSKSGAHHAAIKPLYDYRRKEFFMTRAEHECFDALVVAVGNEYHVFAQVHLSTIVDWKVPGQDWRAARSHIDRKSVDFVLCDKAYVSTKLAIELDDKTHEQEERIARDSDVERVLHDAGIPLLRIQNHGSFDPKALGEQIRGRLSNPERF